MSNIKVQMTRTFKKKDGTQGYGKAGRLTLQEMKFLRHHINDMIILIENHEGEN